MTADDIAVAPAGDPTVDTRTVDTVYGAVEVETVDCAHCGEPTRHEDAIPVTVGGNVTAEHPKNADVEHGALRALCPNCAEALFDYGQDAPRYPRVQQAAGETASLVRRGLGGVSYVGKKLLPLSVTVGVLGVSLAAANALASELTAATMQNQDALQAAAGDVSSLMMPIVVATVLMVIINLYGGPRL